MLEKFTIGNMREKISFNPETKIIDSENKKSKNQRRDKVEITNRNFYSNEFLYNLEDYIKNQIEEKKHNVRLEKKNIFKDTLEKVKSSVQSTQEYRYPNDMIISEIQYDIPKYEPIVESDKNFITVFKPNIINAESRIPQNSEEIMTLHELLTSEPIQALFTDDQSSQQLTENSQVHSVDKSKHNLPKNIVYTAVRGSPSKSRPNEAIQEELRQENYYTLVAAPISDEIVTFQQLLDSEQLAELHQQNDHKLPAAPISVLTSSDQLEQLHQENYHKLPLAPISDEGITYQQLLTSSDQLEDLHQENYHKLPLAEDITFQHLLASEQLAELHQQNDHKLPLAPISDEDITFQQLLTSSDQLEELHQENDHKLPAAAISDEVLTFQHLLASEQLRNLFDHDKDKKFSPEFIDMYLGSDYPVGKEEREKIVSNMSSSGKTYKILSKVLNEDSKTMNKTIDYNKIEFVIPYDERAHVYRTLNQILKNDENNYMVNEAMSSRTDVMDALNKIIFESPIEPKIKFMKPKTDGLKNNTATKSYIFRNASPFGRTDPNIQEFQTAGNLVEFITRMQDEVRPVAARYRSNIHDEYSKSKREPITRVFPSLAKNNAEFQYRSKIGKIDTDIPSKIENANFDIPNSKNVTLIEEYPVTKIDTDIPRKIENANFDIPNSKNATLIEEYPLTKVDKYKNHSIISTFLEKNLTEKQKPFNFLFKSQQIIQTGGSSYIKSSDHPPEHNTKNEKDNNRSREVFKDSPVIVNRLFHSPHPKYNISEEINVNNLVDKPSNYDKFIKQLPTSTTHLDVADNLVLNDTSDEGANNQRLLTAMQSILSSKVVDDEYLTQKSHSAKTIFSKKVERPKENREKLSKNNNSAGFFTNVYDYFYNWYRGVEPIDISDSELMKLTLPSNYDDKQNSNRQDTTSSTLSIPEIIIEYIFSYWNSAQRVEPSYIQPNNFIPSFIFDLIYNHSNDSHVNNTAEQMQGYVEPSYEVISSMSNISSEVEINITNSTNNYFQLSNMVPSYLYNIIYSNSVTQDEDNLLKQPDTINKPDIITENYSYFDLSNFLPSYIYNMIYYSPETSDESLVFQALTDAEKENTIHSDRVMNDEVLAKIINGSHEKNTSLDKIYPKNTLDNDELINLLNSIQEYYYEHKNDLDPIISYSSSSTIHTNKAEEIPINDFFEDLYEKPTPVTQYTTLFVNSVEIDAAYQKDSFNNNSSKNKIELVSTNDMQNNNKVKSNIIKDNVLTKTNDNTYIHSSVLQYKINNTESNNEKYIPLQPIQDSLKDIETNIPENINLINLASIKNTAGDDAYNHKIHNNTLMEYTKHSHLDDINEGNFNSTDVIEIKHTNQSEQMQNIETKYHSQYMKHNIKQFDSAQIDHYLSNSSSGKLNQSAAEINGSTIRASKPSTGSDLTSANTPELSEAENSTVILSHKNITETTKEPTYFPINNSNLQTTVNPIEKPNLQTTVNSIAKPNLQTTTNSTKNMNLTPASFNIPESLINKSKPLIINPTSILKPTTEFPSMLKPTTAPPPAKVSLLLASLTNNKFASGQPSPSILSGLNVRRKSSHTGFAQTRQSLDLTR